MIPWHYARYFSTVHHTRQRKRCILETWRVDIGSIILLFVLTKIWGRGRWWKLCRLRILTHLKNPTINFYSISKPQLEILVLWQYDLTWCRTFCTEENLWTKSAHWLSVFTVRLHVMQRTVLLSQFCPSARPSDACIDKTKQRTANILIPHETAITLVFWHQQWLVGDAPFPLNSALKVTHPLRKTPTSTDFRS